MKQNTKLLKIVLFTFYCLPYSLVFGQDRPILTIQEPSETAKVFSAAISPDGKMIALGGTYTTVWDAQTGEKITQYDKVGVIYSLAFSPDGTQVLSGAYNEKTHLWDLKTGKTIFSWSTGSFDPRLPGDQPWEIRQVEFNVDGTKLAIRGGGNTGIRVFDAITGQQLFKTDIGSFISFLKNTDELLISDYKICYILNVETQLKVRDLYAEGYGDTIAISSNKNYVVNADPVKLKALVMNLQTNEIIDQFNSIGSPGVNDISYQGKLIISKGRNDKNQDRIIYNVNEKREVKRYALDTSKAGGPNSEDTLVKFFPDGKKFLSVNDKTVNIWDISDLTSTIKNAESLGQ